jgi:hypothetical protein
MLHETKRRPGLLAPVAALIFASISLVPRPWAGEVPANGWVVWTSTRAGGNAETFRCRADGTEVTQLTKTGGTYPIWSPDGRWIAYRDTGDQTHLMRPDGSNDRLIGGWHLFWMHDNAGLAMLDGDNGYVLDPDTGDQTPLFKRSEFTEFANTLTHFYAMTHDRRYMFTGTGIYDYGFTGANGTFTQGYSAVLLDMLDKRKIYLVGLGCWPFTPPAGDMVYHINGGGPTWPDIYRMNLADILTRSSYEPEVAHPDPDWGHEYHPQISQDNQWMVYMASQGCHWDWNCNNEIFIHKIGSDSTSRTQVTNDPSFDAFPSIYVGTPWTATDAPRLVLSPNKITFFARNAAVPAPRTALAKSSAADKPGVSGVTATTSASWLDAVVEDNKITVSVRPGQVWQGRCRGTVSVTVPGLENSPGLIQVLLDADETFAVAPIPNVPLDAGVVDADGTIIDANGRLLDAPMVSIDASFGLAQDVPPCDTLAPSIDAGPSPTIDVTPPGKQGGGGCSCSLARSTERSGAFLLFLLALVFRRPSRAARKLNRSR